VTGHEQIGCRAEAEHVLQVERVAGHADISLIELVGFHRFVPGD
jgi:hypothetical protein